jgi:hypothetical protein
MMPTRLHRHPDRSAGQDQRERRHAVTRDDAITSRNGDGRVLPGAKPKYVMFINGDYPCLARALKER